MMCSSSPTEKPLYSHVLATSQLDPRQSQSETPSSSTSVDSDSDSIAQNLGITEMGHLGTERFQVNRRKLEKMIKTPSNIEGVNSAECFFENIMKTTETFITWPRNLKLGARSRKDPYVRIVGRPDDNTWAKGLILANLATRGPLLKMKMAISNIDHPHIIGRGGSNINRIMEETETHVHFPDSNRRNLVDKSNQVSLYGGLDGLEKARNLLRLSTPLLMSFELTVNRMMPKHDTPFIKRLEINLNVKIILFSTQKPNTYLVLVKGSELEAGNVKKALQLLINCMCNEAASQTLVTIQLEMSQQLYDIAKVEDQTHLLTIMEHTQTTITFPEPSEMSQHSQVTITGSIDGVYEAKQELIGYLPIELTFDIVDNQTITAEIMSLASKYGVYITMQQKQRDNTVAVTLKGVEKFVQHLYDAHREILDKQIISSAETEVPKAAHCRALENNIRSEHTQYEGIPTGIWAPSASANGSNFLYQVPSTPTVSVSIWNNSDSNIGLQEQAHPSPLEQQQVEVRTTLTPDSDSSSHEATSGRRSSDWVLMKAAEGAASEDEVQHYECDFDSEDLEVAFIFMSSPTNDTELFLAAPGAERHNGW